VNPGVMRRNLLQRSSPLFFGLSFLTGGFFAPVWVYLMNRDIQKVHHSHFPSLGPIALIALLYPLAWVGQYYAIEHGASSVMLFVIRVPVAITWLALVWVTFGGVVAVGNYVRREGGQVPGSIALVVLVFVFFVSLPLLQRALNDIALRDA
jgi:hypothetical protein